MTLIEKDSAEPDMTSPSAAMSFWFSQPNAFALITAGVEPVPILAILAQPRRCQPNCDKPFMKRIMAADVARADLFEKSTPKAHVVRIANASYFIWRSNPDDVAREMNEFMDRRH
jgi:pimeloyl-ACP methyl ester carboxylesterase